MPSCRSNSGSPLNLGHKASGDRMKVSELVAVLQSTASLYDECGSASRAEALRVLSLLCTGQETKGVTAFVAAVAKALKDPVDVADFEDRRASETVKIAELVPALGQICELSALVGAKVAVKDLRKFIDLLKKHVGDDVGDFVRRSQECLSLPEKGRQATSPKSKKAILVNNIKTIDEYVEDLKRAGTDRIEFEQVFSELKRDKKLKKADLTEIAHRYSGDVIKYKTKDAAKEEIEIAFVRNARFISKLL
jgi:hypothetical protein